MRERERKKNWRILMKLGNKMCMPFCCDDCVYVNILTCLVSKNLDQGSQYFFKLTVFVQNVLFNMYFILYNI